MELIPSHIKALENKTMDGFNRLLRHLYDPEPSNELQEDIFCASRTYSTPANLAAKTNATLQWPAEFIAEVQAKFWLTYRTGFQAIPRTIQHDMSNRVFVRTSSEFTSDTGFGCMIRAAQTLLANAISLISLGPQWRCGQSRELEARILRMFSDSPMAPLSIHKFIEFGTSRCHIPVGEWFGPSAASQSIRALVHDSRELDLYVHVTSEQGGVIYEETILQEALSRELPREVLILIPQRLGLQKINPKYHESILALFSNPFFVGIAGGRPSSAHFFFARQADFLFFLDPHHPQVMLPYRQDLADYTPQELASAHTRRLHRMRVADLDPSMLIGILIKDFTEWRAFKTLMKSSPSEFQLAMIIEQDAKIPSSHRDDLEIEMVSDEEGLQ